MSPINLKGVKFDSYHSIRIHGDDKPKDQEETNNPEQQEMRPKVVPELNASREESMANNLNSPANKSE